MSMKKNELDIIKYLACKPFGNQRELANNLRYSLGSINNCLKSLIANDYLTDDIKLTNKSNELLKITKPKNAIILAAGIGMRMIPINSLYSKGLLKIHNETLIERLIKQLHEVGITDITIIVGFMKERYEYLIDLYNVKLVVNAEYAIKNNFTSLALLANKIDNTYVLPCDIWCKNNPFNKNELYSWYMLSDKQDESSEIKIGRKNKLEKIKNEEFGNTMVGISYLCQENAKEVKDLLNLHKKSPEFFPLFWEECIYRSKIGIDAMVVENDSVFEIDTYDQLKTLDDRSKELKSDVLDIICKVFSCEYNDINSIGLVKKGMTNRSFVFYIKNKKYIMRVPGEGTSELINRKEESTVYNAIKSLEISDNCLYLDSENGYKITEFIDDVHNCDSTDFKEVAKCMSVLKKFHSNKINVNHTFDLVEKIDFYEGLWSQESSYSDYLETKNNVLSMFDYINAQKKQWCLCHIDSVPDNFLINDKNNKIWLIDWEYSAMQDPHVDIAMFAIYSLYEKDEVDKLIDLYFENNCDIATRLKIYCYVAICGLIWSNWCEYKLQLGVDFGEYSLKQYRYAKDYYRYFRKGLN